MKKIHLIAAARPNFMKIAPIYHALLKDAKFEVLIVHTGQHYDFDMSDAFFRDLKLPAPHIHLGVGGGSHAQNVGNTMIAYEKVCETNRPDLVIVVGDVNATMACSIVAKKMHIKVAHLEAGIRSFDMAMPEEINRKVTDSIVDFYWTPSIDANENLVREGVSSDKIKFVGNIMIDSFELLKDDIIKSGYFEKLKLTKQKYAVATFHRPSNVDNKQDLAKLVDELTTISQKIQVVFPIHPRTKNNLQKFELLEKLEQSNVIVMQPLGYVDFMNLVTNSLCVLTDSGGVQEETTYLGLACITFRNSTERPVTVTEGTNVLAELSEMQILVQNILNGNHKHGKIPLLWDGKTASRLVCEISNILDKK